MRVVSFFVAVISCVPAFALDRGPELVEHVKRCIALAEENRSHLFGDALEIPGMSGYKVKHFLNNLCSLPNTSYLEIGCWRGSTLIAALFENQSSINYAVGVDNWSEFGGPKVEFLENAVRFPDTVAAANWLEFGEPRAEFLENVERFIPRGLLHFFEQDCFSMNKTTSFPVPVNIYFYDGNHSFANQELAFTFFNDVFEGVFIAVVDDWNSKTIQKGTLSAFAKLHYEVLFDQAIHTNQNGDLEGWWNGLYIAVIKKPAAL